MFITWQTHIKVNIFQFKSLISCKFNVLRVIAFYAFLRQLKNKNLAVCIFRTTGPRSNGATVSIMIKYFIKRLGNFTLTMGGGECSLSVSEANVDDSWTSCCFGLLSVLV